MGRTLERSMAAIEHAGRNERFERVLPSRHMELVPGGAVEGAARVCPDLRVDSLLAQECEGASRHGAASEVEVERPPEGRALGRTGPGAGQFLGMLRISERQSSQMVEI